MPVTTEFDAARRLIRSTAHGLLALSDILAHLDEEVSRRWLALPELFDATDATTDLSPAQLWSLVDRMRLHARDGDIGPVAIVTNNDVVYGMARMYATLSSRFAHRVHVSRKTEEAERWLDAAAPGGA